MTAHSVSNARRSTLWVAVLALGLAAPAKAEEPPFPPPRPPELGAPGNAGGVPPAQPAHEGVASACLTKLIAGGAAQRRRRRQRRPSRGVALVRRFDCLRSRSWRATS